MPDTLYRIYMDDSGNTDPATTNAVEVRYGGITAVILTADYLDSKFNSGFQTLVEKHFGEGTDGLPRRIHRRVLAKPPDHGPFSVLKDATKKDAWDQESLSMYERAEYTVISACVDKVAWYHRYPTWQGDFYEVLVQAVLERAFFFLRNRGRAEVNLETKNPTRNQRIKAHYRNAMVNGFTFITAERLQTVFTSKELNIINKDDAKPGAQLADLLAGPAMQHVRHSYTGKYPIISPFTEKLTDILEKKKYYREAHRGPRGLGKVFRPQI